MQDPAATSSVMQEKDGHPIELLVSHDVHVLSLFNFSVLHHATNLG